MPSSRFESLRDFLPADLFQDYEATLAAFESDGLTAFRCRPQAVVLPRNNEEVIRTVQWCHENSVPFVARGSGTSLSGGSMPVSDGIVILIVADL